MGIHFDYKSTKSAKLMEKKAKRESGARSNGSGADNLSTCGQTYHSKPP